MTGVKKRRGGPYLASQKAVLGSKEIASAEGQEQLLCSTHLSPLDPIQQEKSLVALGRLLKTKREINGLTRRDMMIKTRIPIDQLESIEDGLLSKLPPVFAKGFLRAYANELGLDTEAILNDYRKMTGEFKTEPPSCDPLTPQYVKSSIGTAGLRSNFRVLFVATGLIIAAFFISFWLWPGFINVILSTLSLGDKLPFPGTKTAATLTEKGTAPLAVISPTESASTVVSSLQTSTFDPANVTLISPSPEPIPIGNVAIAGGSLAQVEPEPITDLVSAPDPIQLGGELTLTSQKDGIWLQLIVDDKPIEHFLLKRGEKITRSAENSIVVITGQANALSTIWNGQDNGLLSDVPIAEITFPKTATKEHKNTGLSIDKY